MEVFCSEYRCLQCGQDTVHRRWRGGTRREEERKEKKIREDRREVERRGEERKENRREEEREFGQELGCNGNGVVRRGERGRGWRGKGKGED